MGNSSDACQNTEKTESCGSKVSLQILYFALPTTDSRPKRQQHIYRVQVKCERNSKKMAIFLVDLEFREKARALLTSKEIFFVLFFIFMALIPWVDVFTVLYGSFGGNATKFWQDFNEVHCNPKFAKLCPT